MSTNKKPNEIEEGMPTDSEIKFIFTMLKMMKEKPNVDWKDVSPHLGIQRPSNAIRRIDTIGHRLEWVSYIDRGSAADKNADDDGKIVPLAAKTKVAKKKLPVIKKAVLAIKAEDTPGDESEAPVIKVKPVKAKKLADVKKAADIRLELTDGDENGDGDVDTPAKVKLIKKKAPTVKKTAAETIMVTPLATKPVKRKATKAPETDQSPPKKKGRMSKADKATMEAEEAARAAAADAEAAETEDGSEDTGMSADEGEIEETSEMPVDSDSEGRDNGGDEGGSTDSGANNNGSEDEEDSVDELGDELGDNPGNLYTKEEIASTPRSPVPLSDEEDFENPFLATQPPGEGSSQMASQFIANTSAKMK